MNLPNKLTIFRIILVPIMVIIPFLGIDGKIFGIPTEWIIIDLIFIIASINLLIQKPYMAILNIDNDTYMNTPIYRILYLAIFY